MPLLVHKQNTKNTFFLLPPWAADYRIFEVLNITQFLGRKKSSFIFLGSFFEDFQEDIINFMRGHSLKKINILGVSLGGFRAFEFGYKFPHLIEKLILVGIRKRYPKEEIDKVRRYILKNRSLYLEKFYEECFSKTSFARERFFSLKKSYLEKFRPQELLSGLDILEKIAINSSSLNNFKKLFLICGEKDKISSLKEAEELKKDLPGADFFTIKEEGHLPFFSETDMERIYGD